MSQKMTQKIYSCCICGKDFEHDEYFYYETVSVQYHGDCYDKEEEKEEEKGYL